jgi:hypothetical protein
MHPSHVFHVKHVDKSVPLLPLWMIRPQHVLSQGVWTGDEVNVMPAAAALLLVRSIINLILAIPVIVVLVILLWKIGKLADAYTKKLKAS